MHCMPWSGLICDEKDRLLATVAVADDDLHDNGSIEAPAKHHTDRIRNAGVGRMGRKQAG
jgi:hypothetical protein